MTGFKSNLFTCLWLMYLMTSCNLTESQCSKFPYQGVLQEKLVRLEFKVEQMDSGIRAIQDDVLEELNKLKKEREDNMAFRKQLEEELRENFNKTVAQVLKQAESVIEEMQGHRPMLVTLDRAVKDLAIAQNLSLQEFAESSNILFRARGVFNLTPSSGETMIYTNVMTNQGSGYNSTNGIFTAPKAGLYLFRAQFCTQSDYYFNFAFYVDGTKKQATSMGSSKQDCITGVMPVELRKSSKVSVKCTSGGYKLFTSSVRWNVFSGVLIRPIKND